MNDLLDTADLVALARHIADGDVSAEAVTQATLARAQAAAPFNAFVRIRHDEALAAARDADLARRRGGPLGRLHGVPLAHKDMFYRKGRITGCGSKIRADFVASETCPLLSRLDAAGAIEIGQLNMSEFAMGPSGHNDHLGRCRNPWDMQAITGGSSSGSGAAVAARVVTSALGSDTGGSVRLPASFCGVAGLKPTHGLLPNTAMMPLSESMDTAGPLARSSRSLARLMTVLTDGAQDYEAGLRTDLRGLTVGLPTAYYTEGLSPDIAAAFAEAAHVLRHLGARVIAVDLPDQSHLAAMAALVWAPEAAAQHLDWLRERPDDYGEQVRNRLMHGLAQSATTYIQARRLRGADLAAMLAGPLAACDIIATPAVRINTPDAADAQATSGTAMDKVIDDLSALTRPISYLGLPALVTPMGFDPRGLPMGLQLIGAPRAEATLLAAAHAFEHASHWLDRPLPPLCVTGV